MSEVDVIRVFLERVMQRTGEKRTLGWYGRFYMAVIEEFRAMEAAESLAEYYADKGDDMTEPQ